MAKVLCGEKGHGLNELGHGGEWMGDAELQLQEVLNTVEGRHNWGWDSV